MPTNATAFLAAGDGINILLPSRIVDEADYALAVAPIPAGKQAVAVIVRTEDGHQATFGLPRITAQGWTTSFTELRSP
ncbi:MAG: hypothetical protein GY939_18330 [Actinomycetia bacterium]|nr:hypothetical protein [Actinomycetes bacterium]